MSILVVLLALSLLILIAYRGVSLILFAPAWPTVFWGPMAFAMMGGSHVATALTLLFLPALYVAWFGLKEPAEALQSPAMEHTRYNRSNNK